MKMELTNEQKAELECFILTNAMANLKTPLDEMLEMLSSIEYFSKPKNRKKVATMITNYISLFFKVKPTSRQYRKNNRISWY